MIEAAICTVLEQTAAIAALVADRITEMPLPQASTLPALTYQVITPPVGDVPARGPSADDLVWVRMQIDCWGETSASVAALGKAVRDRLDGYAGMVDGIRVDGVFLVPGGGSGREYEPETKLRRVRMDFRVHCRKGDA